MRVYISADLEGVSGVVSKEFLDPQGRDYQRGRNLMTGEVNAAIRGAFRGGASQVLVNDAHGPMTNILLEDLEESAELISGKPKSQGMMSGLHTNFDTAFLLGYHAQKGEAGVLSHSFSGGTIRRIKINGTPLGEAGVNTLLAAYYGVPIGFVSGDDCVTEEVRDQLDEVKTATVKWSYSKTAAKCLHPRQAQNKIEQQAYLALKELDQSKAIEVSEPVKLEVDFLDRGLLEKAVFLPGLEVLQDTEVIYQGKDMKEVYDALQALLMMT